MTDSVMGIKMVNESGSGDTTPDYPKTPTAQSSVGNLKYRGSQESLSAITEAGSVESAETGTSSLVYPGPPLNSPMTQSEIGERETPSPANIAERLEESLNQRMMALPGSLSEYTPPTSPDGDYEGKTLFCLGIDVKDFAVWHDPPRPWGCYRLLTPKRTERKRIERTVSRRSEDTATPVLRKPQWGDRTEPNSGKENISSRMFPEHSNWANFAEEDVVSGLKRLARLARDENLVQPDKTVEQIYSYRLAKLIKEAEIVFDKNALE
ncbi:hypothetical protein LTR56_022208 [Elasticomyces elasticus]|nr:hypothetical protein LTR56_022208 [Elasticomyces elasticus]KAK3632398.1 hypothetical protein LTR22_020583 [Elasticomyces elasticus]KAK4917259.1 hypothetical protein LTR49_014880 [Elasticomyces elasticus]KAK5749601.1 hypothetical protein LTS12_020311 [Elasticomyces elasticus]